MKPIIFNSSMVKAILDSRKTQTRRVIKPQPYTEDEDVGIGFDPAFEFHWDKTEKISELIATPNDMLEFCPYGVPGDRLWVRETWKPTNSKISKKTYIHYRADCIGYKFELNLDARVEIEHNFIGSPNDRWRPSIHMPRWASRITLEIKDVRVERVQDISLNDIAAEGVIRKSDVASGKYLNGTTGMLYAWQEFWDSINSKRGYSWESNSWVWVIEFEVVDE